MCKCTKRVITQSNLKRILQSKHLQDSRDSQLSARKPPGSIRARITELEGLELFALFLRMYENRNTPHAVQEQ